MLRHSGTDRVNGRLSDAGGLRFESQTGRVAGKSIPSLWREKHPAIKGLRPPEHHAGHFHPDQQDSSESRQTKHVLRRLGSSGLPWQRPGQVKASRSSRTVGRDPFSARSPRESAQSRRPVAVAASGSGVHAFLQAAPWRRLSLPAIPTSPNQATSSGALACVLPAVLAGAPEEHNLGRSPMRRPRPAAASDRGPQEPEVPSFLPGGMS